MRAFALRLGGALAALALGAATIPAAMAMTWETHDIRIRLDNRLTGSLMLRTQDADDRLVGIANGGDAYSVNADDATLAYPKGSLVAATARVTTVFAVSAAHYGLFARSTSAFDPRIDGKSLFDPSDFGAGHQFERSRRRAAEHETWDRVGSDFALLDAYVYGDIDLAGHDLTLKVGQQVVSWGEALFVLNGLNGIQAYDANRALSPAAELDEITRPYPQIFASLDLWSGLSLEGWYQLKWRRTIAPYAGTFFANVDFTPENAIAGNIDFGRAGEYAVAGSECRDPGRFPPGFTFSCVPFGGSIPRGEDRAPGDRRQFGISLTGTLPVLRSLVFALYGANYHSRLPLYSSISAASGNPDAGTARIIGEYPENIRMVGVSFNGSGPLGLAVQGEYSYRPNQPLEIDDVEQSLADLGLPSQFSPVAGQTLGNQYIRGWRRHEVSLWDLSAIALFGPNATFGYDELLVMLEAAFVRVHDLEPTRVLRYEGPGTFLPGDAATAALLNVPRQKDGFATANSSGLILATRATWHNILPRVQFKPSLRLILGVNGTTPAPLQNFVEDTLAIRPNLQFEIGSATSIDLGYTLFTGGGQSNTLIDRDFVSLDVKFSF
jgi:hypothetical protein